MELADARRRRHMVRAFTSERVPADVVDDLLDAARRAPSAGNTQAVRFLVLDTPEATSRFWDITLPASRRDAFAFPGLLAAPVLVLILVDPAAYVARYAEPDKADTGLGSGLDAWSVPYWWVDGGAVVQNLLLGAVEVALGACLFGLFDAEEAVLEAHGVPPGWRAVGAIALGRSAPDRPGRSSSRPRPPLDSVTRRSAWSD